jgi:hypothetical protein
MKARMKGSGPQTKKSASPNGVLARSQSSVMKPRWSKALPSTSAGRGSD